MSWLSSNAVEIGSLLFGAGGIGYAIVQRIMDHRRYEQEVRSEAVTVDIKSDEFWKSRYDVLEGEMKNKDAWWKERYDNLYAEFQDERKLSNEIIRSFRTELNEIRADYEREKETERKRYDDLMAQYVAYQREVETKSREQLARIAQLEQLVSEYEARLDKKQ